LRDEPWNPHWIEPHGRRSIAHFHALNGDAPSVERKDEPLACTPGEARRARDRREQRQLVVHAFGVDAGLPFLAREHCARMAAVRGLGLADRQETIGTARRGVHAPEARQDERLKPTFSSAEEPELGAAFPHVSGDNAEGVRVAYHSLNLPHW